ncbi:helix-turn-helix domain-containing protein [Streptococcus salivarius]
MKNTTASRLQQVMSERNLKQVDVISLSKVHQKELGVKLGKSALSQYINGKSTPDQEKLVLLARTLGVSEAWLMGYDVPMAKEQPQSQPNTHDIDNIIDNAMMFDGKPLTEDDKRAIRGIIAGYMSSKEK